MSVRRSRTLLIGCAAGHSVQAAVGGRLPADGFAIDDPDREAAFVSRLREAAIHEQTRVERRGVNHPDAAPRRTTGMDDPRFKGS